MPVVPVPVVPVPVVPVPTVPMPVFPGVVGVVVPIGVVGVVVPMGVVGVVGVKLPVVVTKPPFPGKKPMTGGRSV